MACIDGCMACVQGRRRHAAARTLKKSAGCSRPSAHGSTLNDLTMSDTTARSTRGLPSARAAHRANGTKKTPAARSHQS
eukprot:4798118-Prymnesium_polylepis.1